VQRIEECLTDPIRYIYSLSGRRAESKSNVRLSLSLKAILIKLGTGPSFCCTQYICRNQPDRITISYSCHRNDRIGINI